MNDRELKTLCRAIGDVTRLQIIRSLAAATELNVTELAQTLVLSQPLASWHVRILKRAGILLTRKNGRQVYCSLETRRFGQLQRALTDLVQPGLTSEPAAGSTLTEPAAIVSNS